MVDALISKLPIAQDFEITISKRILIYHSSIQSPHQLSIGFL